MRASFKAFLKVAYLSFCTLLSFRPASPFKPKTLIILRTDAIGDYLLFRAFLRELREHYPSYHITLLGNPAWKELALYFDKAYIDSYLWFAPKDFKNPLRTIPLLRALRKHTFEILLSPLHSRDFTTEFLARRIKAREKIAPQGDCINSSPEAKQRADRTYTTLTESSPGILFEFYRNKEFFERALGKPLHTPYALHPHARHRLALDSHATLEKFALHAPFCLLFIGASAPYRKWSIAHFAQVGVHLLELGLDVVVCGGREDAEAGRELERLINSSFAAGHSALRLKSAMCKCEFVASPLHSKARGVDEPLVLSPCSPCQSPDLSSQILECLGESLPKDSYIAFAIAFINITPKLLKEIKRKA